MLSDRMAAALTAFGSFLTGVVAMWVISITTSTPPGVPGFWDSWGGTVGDLVLPVIVYLLVRGIQLPRDRSGVGWISVAAGLVGSVGGAMVQLSWIVDDAAVPNWVFTSTHHFSVAGWYHAGYVVLMAGLLGVLGAEFITRGIRRRTAPTRDVVTVVGPDHVAILTTAVLVYASTVVLDSFGSLETMASRATVILLGCAASVFCCATILVLGYRIRETLVILATAAIGTGAAVALMVQPSGLQTVSMLPASLSSASVGLAAGLAVWHARRSLVARYPLTTAAAVVPAALTVIAFALDTAAGIVIGVIGIAAVIIVGFLVLRRYPDGDPRKYVCTGMWVAAIVFTVNCVLGVLAKSNPRASSWITIFVVGVFLAFAVIPLGVQLWKRMSEAERSRAPHLAEATYVTWSIALLLVLSFFLSALPAIGQVATVPVFGGPWIPVTLVLAGPATLSALIVALPLLRMITRGRPAGAPAHPLSMGVLPRLYRVSCLVGLVGVSATTCLQVVDHGLGLNAVQTILLTTASVVYTAHTVETLIANSVLLRWRRPSVTDYGIAAVTAVTSALLLFTGIAAGPGARGLLPSLTSLVLLTTCQIAVQHVGAGILAGRGTWTHKGMWSTSWVTIQDELARMFAFLIAAWVPISLLRTLTIMDEDFWMTWLAIIVAIGPAAIFGWSQWVQHEADEYARHGQHVIAGIDRSIEPGDFGPAEIWVRAWHLARSGTDLFRPTLRLRATGLTQTEWARALSSHLGSLILLTGLLTSSTGAALLLPLQSLLPRWSNHRNRAD